MRWIYLGSICYKEKFSSLPPWCLVCHRKCGHLTPINENVVNWKMSYSWSYFSVNRKDSYYFQKMNLQVIFWKVLERLLSNTLLSFLFSFLSLLYFFLNRMYIFLFLYMFNLIFFCVLNHIFFQNFLSFIVKNKLGLFNGFIPSMILKTLQWGSELIICLILSVFFSVNV